LAVLFFYACGAGVCLLWLCSGWFGMQMVLAFPCFAIGLFALPLCGAALTSLCRPQREVSKRKRLTPLILKWVPRAATVVVHLESVPPHIPRQ
jgi:hypothetical protein